MKSIPPVRVERISLCQNIAQQLPLRPPQFLVRQKFQLLKPAAMDLQKQIAPSAISSASIDPADTTDFYSSLVLLRQFSERTNYQDQATLNSIGRSKFLGRLVQKPILAGGDGNPRGAILPNG